MVVGFINLTSRTMYFISRADELKADKEARRKEVWILLDSLVNCLSHNLATLMWIGMFWQLYCQPLSANALNWLYVIISTCSIMIVEEQQCSSWSVATHIKVTNSWDKPLAKFSFQITMNNSFQKWQNYKCTATQSKLSLWPPLARKHLPTPLISNHFSKIPKFSQSNHCIWNLLQVTTTLNNCNHFLVLWMVWDFQYLFIYQFFIW